MRSHLASLAVFVASALALVGCSGSGGGAGGNPRSSADAGADRVTAITEITDAPGQTTGLTLDPTTMSAFKSLGVSLAPLGSATISNGEILFPITSGYAEIHTDRNTKPGYVMGSLQHDTSGFSLTAGSTTVDLSNFVIDPGGSTLYGTVDGTKAGIPLLTLNGSALQQTLDGTTLHLDGTVATLTQTAATALDAAFNTTAVSPGLELGVAHITLDASGAITFPGAGVTTIPLLSGTLTAITLVPATVTALSALGISLTSFGTATIADGIASFPITGGFLGIHPKGFQPRDIVGSVDHEASGLTFTAGNASVTVEDFTVDPGNSVVTAYIPKLKAVIPLLSFDGSALKVSMSGNNYVLEGPVASLTSRAAKLLDGAFGTSAITAGLPLGTLKLVASPAAG